MYVYVHNYGTLCKSLVIIYVPNYVPPFKALE